MQLRSRYGLYRILLFALFIFLLSPAYSQTVRGSVFDSRSGEPLVGASVHLEHTKYYTLVNLDGSYVFKGIQPGTYLIGVSLVGYKKPKEIEITVNTRGVSAVDLAMETDVAALLEVLVTGNADKGSDRAVRNIEKNGDMVQNMLSEKTIQLLPDVTVGNALQRVSGVTVQRDNTGEGRYAIIRGMDQRYNNTLVNGIKIPSPDDRFRFVPMDIFPSEMLERLEVIKALTPNMEGDAIGGTMNLVMKSAPSRFLFTANVSGGYNTLFSDRPFTSFPHGGINRNSPAEIQGNGYAANPITDFPVGNLHYSNNSAPVNSTLGMTIGNRFLNKKLGVILSASYQNFYKGSTSQRLIPDAQPLTAPAANTPSFSDAYVRQYNTHTNRIGLQNKIDYVFNSRNTISLFNLYLRQNDYESRYTPDTTVGLNSSATQSQLSIENRSTWQIQDIYNATLHGEHQLSSKLVFDWSGVYSIAKKEVPDQASYNFDAKVTRANGGKTVTVDSTISQGTGVMTRIWQHNKDQDLAGYADLTYTTKLIGRIVEFKAGGLYRYKTRDNYFNKYSLQADTSGEFHSVDQLPRYFQTPADATGNITAINPNSYTAHEKITAGFIQAKFMLFRSLQVLGGVRVENTQQDYTTVMPLTYSGAYGSIHYTDVLPSVHLKYLLNDRQNLRLSYFKSISRPGFGEIVPYSIPGEDFTEIGNPNLKHVQADNLDFRYEWFMGHADQLLLGAFYKKLENPIEYFVTRDASPSSLYIQPQNVNQATNLGLEAVFTKYFGMFGISANYTYTHSQITTTKLLYHVVAGVGTQTSDTTQKRPLQGQANNVGNISLLFKDPRIGLDLQLALVYTGDRIAQVSQYYGLDIWQKPFSQLDISLEKKIAGRFSFYAKVNNITNSPNKEYIKTPYSVVNGNFQGGYTIPFQDKGSNYTVAQRDIYKMSLLGGFRFKF
jgi:outer membrane receptor protein involved in Fe transport